MTAKLLRGALVALLACGLLCAHRAAASATCTPIRGANANTAVTFNNCTQVCCASGVVPAYNDDLSTCCHDAGTSFCPGGMKCCTPTPAITPTSSQAQVPRACYSEDYQACCSWQAKPDYDSSQVPTKYYFAKTFFKDRHQCCMAQGNGYFDNSSSTPAPIVPKYASSCVQHLHNEGVYFRCFADGDCPTGSKCCRRPQQSTETTTGIYDVNAPGKCYDPNYTSCCGGGAGIKIGSAYNVAPLASAVKFIEAELYDPMKTQCCTLPVYNGTTNSAPNFTVPLSGPESQPCPCLASTDCPAVGSVNFTCCAPSEAIIHAQGVAKRLIKCDAGCPAAGYSGGVGSFFEGCLGQCIAGPGPNKLDDKVCMVGTALGNRCDNMRVLSGIPKKILPPTAWDLVKTDASAHWLDCCPSSMESKAFSLLYDTQKELCCPVIGTRGDGGKGGGRLLAPTVSIQDVMTSVGDNQERCMCAGDSDCPNGQTCCAGANHLVSKGTAALNYGNFTGLCYDARQTSCCPFKTNMGFSVAKVYDHLNEQCCATGVQTIYAPCQCHADTDCTAPSTACCTSAVRYGNGTHGVGTCYDTRTQSCCQSYALATGATGVPIDNSRIPIEDSRITGVPTAAKVYNNATEVCCKWNGVADDITKCMCRHDRSDCPGSTVCCASNGTQPGVYGQARYSLGKCINPRRQGCCVSKWMSRDSPPEVYDKERKVCCPNNGVQRDHRECKCASNAECPASGECCVDAQAAANDVRYQCNDDTTPGCPGRCVHTALETCCDDPLVSEFAGGKSVKACAVASQKCCDGQCCNKATQTCKKTHLNRQELNGDSWSAFKPSTTVGYHYGMDVEKQMCTTAEHSSPSIVFHTWVFPAFLSIASILFIAAGTKSALGADISPNVVKLGMVGISVFVGIMSLLLLWSPLWKYGFVIVVANKIILALLAAPGVWPKRFAVAVAVVCFLWVVEPFGSNSILNFGTTTYAGNTMNSHPGAHGSWYNAHGLNYAARLLQRPRDESTGSDACTAFYQYWMVDDKLHDARNWNPKGATRGICRRSWMHTITVMAGLITPFQTIFLLLAGLALARGTEGFKDMKVQPA